jgi:hypothetical protein
MTANELADLIENEDTLWLEPHLNTIATMLRQQQAEIEALKLRELTDREIASVCKEHLAPKNCDIYTFARAILQRASEQ